MFFAISAYSETISQNSDNNDVFLWIKSIHRENIFQNKHKMRQNIQQIRTSHEPVVYKRRAYGLLKKLIHEGKFSSLRMCARTIGVRPETVQSWLKMPEIQRLLADDIDIHIQAIERSKDWKAHAYLLERLIGEMKQTGRTTSVVTVYTDKKKYQISGQSGV